MIQRGAALMEPRGKQIYVVRVADVVLDLIRDIWTVQRHIS